MSETSDELAKLRADIDRLDERLVDLVDEAREAAVKTRYVERFEAAGLDGSDGRALATHLIEVALARERDLQSES